MSATKLNISAALFFWQKLNQLPQCNMSGYLKSEDYDGIPSVYEIKRY